MGAMRGASPRSVVRCPRFATISSRCETFTVADELVAELNKALPDGIHECKRALAYTPTYFIRMLSESGPVATVRQLVTQPVPSEGFTRLWEDGRLDLTVEFVALWPEFSPLFDDIQSVERARLERYGFDCDWNLAAR